MNRRTPTTDVALVAGFAALIAVCAILPDIKTGVGVPYSLQTLGVLLAGAVLGPLRGFLAVLLYLAAGLVLPIYSGGTSGLAHYTGLTAGYLVAFPLAAALCGYLVHRSRGNATQFAFVFTCGLLSSVVFIHTLGPLNLAWRADMSIKEAFVIDTAYFPGDILKNVVMALIATAVHRAFPDLVARRTKAEEPVPAPA
ncbi:MAG TPA: biotin transporter BioY [Nocardioides sp.]|nr:biotin transporter BioY [Nocardioides sp.]